jgi:predicted transcriptional regulator
MTQLNTNALNRLLAIFAEREGYLFAQETEIRALLKEMRGQRAAHHLAVELGISPNYLYTILRGDQLAGDKLYAALKRMRVQAEQRGETLPTIEQGGAA